MRKKSTKSRKQSTSRSAAGPASKRKAPAHKKPKPAASKVTKAKTARKKQVSKRVKPARAGRIISRKRPSRIKATGVKARVKGELEEINKPPVVEAVRPVAAQPVAAPETIPAVDRGAPTVEKRVEPPQANEVELSFPVSVKDLAVRLQLKPSRLIQELMQSNIFATINQLLSQEDATLVCERFGYKVKCVSDKEEQILAIYRQKDDPKSLRPRPPIVTLMGHVDHGKTSLLDMIKKSNIVDVEHGGITQHIGAYEVNLPKGKITFLDTPGHEAFTAMRSRGAHITDIVVLVVAADDGIMPQTIEAVDHARAANVPIVVAINKIDRPQADVDRVKKQLSKIGLTAEDWQGKTITVGVSAKTGEGIGELLDMILLEAEMLELKANYSKSASGVIIESRHDKNRGTLATLLIEGGTLHLNDNIVSGLASGKIKAMFGDYGNKIQEAPPGTPVEVLGLSGMPEAGEPFFVVDEKQARELVCLRQDKQKQQRVQPVKRISLEDLHSGIKQGKIKELKIIIKADVGGSLEAVRDSLEKLEVSEVKFQIIHAGVGPINYSDAMLAKVTDALILGFHVQPDERAKALIEQEGIETRTYNIIYELINELKAALEGLLEPKIKKIFLGRARIRKVFNLSRSGIIAGCMVSKGKITRSASASLVRDDQVIFEGKISSLKRFKDDVREVAEGFECGISLSGFEDYREGDIIEAFQIQEIARKL